MLSPHLPNVEETTKAAEARFDTMALVLARLSQANKIILANTLHTMGMANLWRRETVMNNLSPQLEMTRRQALRNSSFLTPGLFDPSLIAETETYLLEAQRPPQQGRRQRSPTRRGTSHSGSGSHRSQPSPQPFHQRVPLLLSGLQRSTRLSQGRKERPRHRQGNRSNKQ